MLAGPSIEYKKTDEAEPAIKYNVQPLLAEGTWQVVLREKEKWLEDNPMGISVVLIQEDVYTGKRTEVYSRPVSGQDADAGLKCHTDVKPLEAYWTRLLTDPKHGFEYKLASDPEKSFHLGMPGSVHGDSMDVTDGLRDHKIDPAVKGYRGQTVFSDVVSPGGVDMSSKLEADRHVILGNTVYVKFGKGLIDLCGPNGLEVAEDGWNANLAQYNNAKRIPRRSAGFGTVKCKGHPIITLGSGHLSGGRFDDPEVLEQVLSGDYERSEMWKEGKTPRSATARCGSRTPEGAGDDLAMGMRATGSASSTTGTKQGRYLEPTRPTGFAGMGGTTPASCSESLLCAMGSCKSPARPGRQLSWRGAGTLVRAQVRAFLEAMFRNGKTKAMILGLDLNSKPDMPVLHKVLTKYVIAEQMKPLWARMLEEDDDFGTHVDHDFAIKQQLQIDMPGCGSHVDEFAVMQSFQVPPPSAATEKDIATPSNATTEDRNALENAPAVVKM
ncbi:unnamed protein product [Amoebophrya sp. A25]|nr:unnamed protein product [Amoebophrya sp. A25]|eukprot:GSA25T00005035001.1